LFLQWNFLGFVDFEIVGFEGRPRVIPEFCISKIVFFVLLLKIVEDCIAIVLMVFFYAYNIVISIDNEKRKLQFLARLAHIV